jgi:IS30 family transposase
VITTPQSNRIELAEHKGAEMAQHVQLRIDTGLAAYFCDPRSGACQGTCRCAKKESDSTSLYMLYP